MLDTKNRPKIGDKMNSKIALMPVNITYKKTRIYTYWKPVITGFMVLFPFSLNY